MGSKIKVIVATHKKYHMPESDIYLPLQVGAKGKEKLGYECDDSGDNISEKNPYFCELTGLYWAWKNLDCEYIGLSHYRRHFSYKNSHDKDKFQSVLNTQQAEKLCLKYNVILPKKRRYYIESLYSHYKHTHYSIHLDMTRDIISKMYPDYIKTYEKTLKQTYGYMFNMFIMDKKLADKYCSWLFSILFELEKNIKAQKVHDDIKLTPFHARFYGRVSEILFNVWLNYQLNNNKIKKEDVIEIGCIHMDPINWFKKISVFLRAKFFKKKYTGSF